MKLFSLILALIMTCFVFQRCTHEPMPVAKKSCNLPATVSFSADIIPIFTNNCALSGCHSGSSPQGNLNLEAPNAYAQLFKPGKGYVDTTHPEFSIIYTQLYSTSEPMPPPPAARLDDCKQELLLKWIQQKAPNN